jgi:methylenetetrahydrofolate--tRNA-(uracil-5-)-methyltransferase
MAKATVVGAGLAGCEAALQLARHGIDVELWEMKPARRSPAHHSDDLAELVCSNSLRGAALTNAVGLLKEELRRAGSVVMECADATRVPAGGALAVDRERFSAMMTERVQSDPRISVVRREAIELPEERPLILATGPLTADGLAQTLEALLGTTRLAYYDAIAPIVSAESVDWSVVWRQSRYDKGEPDYANCPFDAEQYEAFVEALRTGEQVKPHSFEKVKYFEGCLPCEVMAERGPRTLSFGPLKPVGLTDPRTGKRPHAVLQLRPEDRAATAYNLVGMQTRLTYPEQKRVFRMVPGLEQAEFLRLGSIHRNTFLDAPKVLDATMQLRDAPGAYVAGQLSGVEGYVESTASGLLCGLHVARLLHDLPPCPPPPTTAFGAILTHLHQNDLNYQPSNITWAHFPPLDPPVRLKKRARYEHMAERALNDFTDWVRSALMHTQCLLGSRNH